MGSDQSTPISPPEQKKGSEDDVPYTSFSVNRPVDGESDSTAKFVSKAQEQAKHKASMKDIVVVAEGQHSYQSTDPELIKIQEIPTFLPIMRGSLNIPNMRDPDVLDKLDSKEVLKMCLRYQEHMKQCAEAVAFDQNSLTNRTKEMDFAIAALTNMMTDHQKKYAKYAEQIMKINEMSQTLKRCQMAVDQLLPLMDRLNSVLPEEQRLEPFSMRPDRSTTDEQASSSRHSSVSSVH
ncbi:BORCS5 [Branchiostoma lanceolatum]|uniref:BLOC-1-related complex subunit 5 n=2 Tax=Branchiostoma lanceolatum TaxID=7740 RepID=A0A8J9ZC99_BRALA|nr:BORCS5 [Branchiostoma lanceolatum]